MGGDGCGKRLIITPTLMRIIQSDAFGQDVEPFDKEFRTVEKVTTGFRTRCVSRIGECWIRVYRRRNGDKR